MKTLADFRRSLENNLKVVEGRIAAATDDLAAEARDASGRLDAIASLVAKIGGLVAARGVYEGAIEVAGRTTSRLDAAMRVVTYANRLKDRAKAEASRAAGEFDSNCRAGLHLDALDAQGKAIETILGSAAFHGC